MRDLLSKKNLPTDAGKSLKTDAVASSSSAGLTEAAVPDAGFGRGFSAIPVEKYVCLRHLVLNGSLPDRQKTDSNHYRFLQRVKGSMVPLSVSDEGGVDVFKDETSVWWTKEQKDLLTRIIGVKFVSDDYLCSGEMHYRLTETLVRKGSLSTTRLLVTAEEAEEIVDKLIRSKAFKSPRILDTTIRINYSGFESRMVCYNYLIMTNVMNRQFRLKRNSNFYWRNGIK